MTGPLPTQGLPPRPKYPEAMQPPGTAAAVAEAITRAITPQQDQEPQSIDHRNRALTAFLVSREPPYPSRLQVSQGSGGMPSRVKKKGGGGYEETDLTESGLLELRRQYATAVTLMRNTVMYWTPVCPKLADATEWYGDLNRGANFLSPEAVRLFEKAWKLALQCSVDLLKAGGLIETIVDEPRPLGPTGMLDPIKRPQRDFDSMPKASVQAPDQIRTSDVLSKIAKQNLKIEFKPSPELEE